MLGLGCYSLSAKFRIFAYFVEVVLPLTPAEWQRLAWVDTLFPPQGLPPLLPVHICTCCASVLPKYIPGAPTQV